MSMFCEHKRWIFLVQENVLAATPLITELAESEANVYLSVAILRKTPVCTWSMDETQYLSTHFYVHLQLTSACAAIVFMLHSAFTHFLPEDRDVLEGAKSAEPPWTQAAGLRWRSSSPGTSSDWDWKNEYSWPIQLSPKDHTLWESGSLQNRTPTWFEI